MGYAPDSSKHAVPASSVIEFMEFLKKVMTRYPEKLYISKNEFTSLLTKLATAGHLTAAQVQHYTDIIPAIYTIEDMCHDAKATRNADLALRIAQEKAVQEKPSSNGIIYWLNQAKHFNPEHSFFATPENVTACLNGIETTNIDYLFEEGDSANWLLDQIAICPTLKKLTFDSVDGADSVTETFANFLIKSNNIKELAMNRAWGDWHAKRMTDKHAKILARGLRSNSSVESVNLNDHRIGDEGLIVIVDALVANSATKLKSLDIVGNGITNRGVRYLLENLDKIPSLRSINLELNSGCSESETKAVYAVLEARRNDDPVIESMTCSSAARSTSSEPSLTVTANLVRQTLIERLETYIERIEDNATERGNPNFHYGFSFFKNSQALNRHANYLLAESLLQELKSGTTLTEIFEGNKVFRQRQALIDKAGLRTRDYVERGIGSKELNGIIRAGVKLGQEEAHAHEDVAPEVRPSRP
jgi:hypothetical protein